MTNREIYNALRAGGMTRAGALGTMANMRAESAMRPNNVQDSCGIDDETYTAEVNVGLRDFLDGIGYGYCQWTASDRKAKLLAYARSVGASIDDPAMQVAFCLREMRADFPGVWKIVSTSDNLRDCTWSVLDVYENPKIKNLGTRYTYAQEFSTELTEGQMPTVDTAPAAHQKPATGMDYIVAQLQLCMAHDGYWSAEEITGVKTDEFRQRIVEYAEDVAGC